MYKDVLRTIDGVGIFPVVSLILFVLFFAFVLWGTMRANKAVIDSLADIPLHSGSANELENTKTTNNE